MLTVILAQRSAEVCVAPAHDEQVSLEGRESTEGQFCSEQSLLSALDVGSGREKPFQLGEEVSTVVAANIRLVILQRVLLVDDGRGKGVKQALEGRVAGSKPHAVGNDAVAVDVDNNPVVGGVETHPVRPLLFVPRVVDDSCKRSSFSQLDHVHGRRRCVAWDGRDLAQVVYLMVPQPTRHATLDPDAFRADVEETKLPSSTKTLSEQRLALLVELNLCHHLNPCVSTKHTRDRSS